MIHKPLPEVQDSSQIYNRDKVEILYLHYNLSDGQFAAAYWRDSPHQSAWIFPDDKILIIAESNYFMN